MLYALLPESLRFSRALILFGTLWLAIEMSVTRLIGIAMGKEKFGMPDLGEERVWRNFI